MSAAVVTFEHAGGVRELSHARFPPQSRAYAHASESTTGFAFVRGDGRPLPSPLSVTAVVDGGSGRLRDAYALAYAIAEEAVTATSVTLHYGSFTTDGVLGYGMQPEGNTIVLTLEFALTSATRVVPP